MGDRLFRARLLMCLCLRRCVYLSLTLLVKDAIRGCAMKETDTLGRVKAYFGGDIHIKFRVGDQSRGQTGLKSPATASLLLNFLTHMYIRPHRVSYFRVYGGL